MWPLKDLVMGTAVDSQSNTVFTLFFIHCVCECVSVCLCGHIKGDPVTPGRFGTFMHSLTVCVKGT